MSATTASDTSNEAPTGVDTDTYTAAIWSDVFPAAFFVTGAPWCDTAHVMANYATSVDTRPTKGRRPDPAVALARNPHADPAALCDIIAEHIDTRVHRIAAANPAVAGLAEQLWGRHGPDTDSGLLANPGVRCEFLVDDSRWRRDPSAALANPNLDATIVDDCLAAGIAVAWRHPNLDPERIAAGINHPDHQVRYHLADNRSLELDTLELFAATERAREPGRVGANDTNKAVLELVGQRIRARSFLADPWSSSAKSFTNPALRHPDVVARIAALDEDHRGAIRALLAAEFAGTLSELIDVAATFDASTT
jgi:hypothetical protein